MAWLRLLKDQIAANAEVTLDDVYRDARFADRGGRIAAGRALGRRERLPGLLDELSEALVA